MNGHSERSKDNLSTLWVALLFALLVHVVGMMVVGLMGLLSLLKEPPRQEIVMVPVEMPAEPGLPVPPPPIPDRDTPKPLSPPSSRRAPTPPVQEPTTNVEPEPVLPEEAVADPNTSKLSQEELASVNLDLNWKSFSRVFSEESTKARETHVAASLTKRRQSGMFAGMTGKVKRALATNRGWAKPGNQEPLGNRRKTFYRYIKAIHEERIHPIFGHGFWESLQSLGSAHELNDMSLHTLAEFEILENGAVNEVRVVRTSGNLVFDAAAVDSVYRGSPFPPPPKEILSWNGRVYLKWGFYRSRRMCGVFNVNPYVLKAPGDGKEEVQIDDLISSDNSPG